MDVPPKPKKKESFGRTAAPATSIEALTRGRQVSVGGKWTWHALIPIGSHMDASPDEVVSVLKEMRPPERRHRNENPGPGRSPRPRRRCPAHALSLGVLDAFYHWRRERNEQEDLIRRVAAA